MYFSACNCIDIAGRSSGGVYNQNTMSENGDF